MRDDVDWTRKIGERQGARIEVLDGNDSRVVAQRPVQLPVADVEGDDARRSALEQHVGEASGRCADVERLAAVHLDAEGIEGMRQLEPAAADVRMVSADQRDLGGGLDLRARFADDLAVDGHLRGENQRPRPLARRSQTLVRNQLIESDFRQCERLTIQRPMSMSRVCARPAVARARSARSRHSAAIARAASRPYSAG